MSKTSKLILASSSPWRARLLKEAGFDFKIIATDIDETTDMQSIPDPEKLVQTLALKKAQACQLQADLPNTILAADTIVWADNQIIGKPINRQDAKRIIGLLSGTTHQVWTGVCILKPHEQHILFAEKSEVTFRGLSSVEVEAYLDTNDWVGKAGAYQLQLNISKFVTYITGDHNNIIGLPTKTFSLLS